MSILPEEKCDYYPIEDIAVNSLYDYYVDLGNLQDLCDDMKSLVQKEQIMTCGSVKYSVLIEDEAFLIEDIAKLASDMLVRHKNVINAFRKCRTNRELKVKEITKPKK